MSCGTNWTVVFVYLKDHQLLVKAEKCEFHVPTVSFMSLVISSDNIKMDPSKVSAVAEWLAPTSCKEVPQFIAANFYRQFTRNFS